MKCENNHHVLLNKCLSFYDLKNNQRYIFFMNPSIKIKLVHSFTIVILFLKKNLYGPFLWMGFNCLKAIEPLRGGSLLFTTKFPEIPGTHFSYKDSAFPFTFSYLFIVLLF